MRIFGLELSCSGVDEEGVEVEAKARRRSAASESQWLRRKGER